MQSHIEKRELDLTQGLQAALEIAGRNHLVEERARQGRLGIDMGGHRRDDVPFPAEVLHELAGQFDCIPFDARNARDAKLIDAGEHMVQSVPELVKQRDHIVMRQERGLGADWCLHIAGQVGHRCLQTCGDQLATAGIVHPGARTLARAREHVEIELPDQLTGPLNAKEPDIGVPDFGVVARNPYVEELSDQPEEALQDAGQLEILFDLIV